MIAFSRRPLRTALLSLLVPAVVVSGVAAVGTQASAAPAVDGLTPSTAAASCWEIKQNDSSSPSGTYWILTPQLQVPTPIYCDQATDGGGWALIGRGRDNWTYNYNGKGTPAEVAGTITGQAAFAPRQLDSVVINGLLGGKRFDDPAYGSGVRIRRALNQAGTDWQETRWTYRANTRDRWSWALGAGFPLATVNIGGSTGTNTTTYEFGSDSGYRRLWTHEHARNSYVIGFNYGQNAIGSTAADSYIYSKAPGGAYGTPFSQVFIRPKVRSSDLTFPSIPTAGTAAQTIRPAPRNGSLASSWGVTGLGNGGTSENATEVQAFAQIGNTMYVGGNFTTVLKGAAATGADRVAQPYLAAFDATTGDYIRSFTPRLNSMVKALVALPNGKLAVGGEFTTVDGTARKGLVVVDPQTGALDPAWTTNVENRVSGGSTVSVRGLDVDGTYLYATGAFTHFTKPGTGERYAKNGARILLSSGTADNGWNPEFNGTGTAVDVSDDKTQVYFSGYFTQMKGGAPADRAAAISTGPGGNKAASWQPTFSTSGSARYQQAIQQVGDKVWLGGSQHSMFAYDKTTFALENAHISKDGGDVQAITGGNGLVFGGCHCEDWNYSDTTQYDISNPGTTNVTWSQGDKIYYVGAWDATTGDYVQEFTPTMRARTGLGAWALKVDDKGVLWAGGTMTSAVKENGSNQWVGGFVRYAPRPDKAPAVPTAVSAALTGTDAKISWSSSAPSGTTFEVLRNDRVVATTSARTVTVPDSSGADRFFVRAADSWGNRSASSAAVTANVAPVTSTLVASGGSWRYHFDNAAPLGSGWKDGSYDDAAWRTGTAPLGWGTGPVATDIDVATPSARALTSYYRKSFTIGAGSTFGEVKVNTRADDGIVVHVNGVEVGRSNMPTGTPTAGTYASTAVSTTTALANPVTFDVPVSALRIGSNQVAVEVHSNYRGTPSATMDLSITSTPGSAAPGPQVTTTPLVAEGATWSYLFDNGTAVPADWKTSASDTAGWATGAAALGWGTGSIATDIDVPQGATRALTAYFRRSFDVSDAASLGAVQLVTRADDGVAVYINGEEVGRSNLPAGPLTPTTYATAARSTATAISSPVTFTVPPGLLRDGVNSIAVEVHSNYRATPNTSMDLSLTATS